MAGMQPCSFRVEAPIPLIERMTPSTGSSTSLGNIGESTFRPRPDPFIGFELGSVGGKMLEAQSAIWSQ
jgi:hypothetical protein